MDVMKRVREHYEIAKSVFPEDLIVGVFLYGSQNYGMADEQSDVDAKVLVVPSLADVVCARRPVAFEHHCDNGEHLCFTDIREFVHQIRKQNPNSMEPLFTEYYVLNPVFKGVWYDLWSQREDFARLNTCKALDTMRHMANKEYHQMKKNGFDHKKLATMFRIEKMMYDYEIGCKYEDVLKTDQADFFLKVKRGKFVDDDEQGMRLAEDSYEAINRCADRHLKYVPDVYNEKVSENLMKALTDFICMHLGYEIEVKE